MILPETRLLQAAITLAEELNFSRAAERLRVDQSTLSKRILELENQLDVHLFERNHQKVALTDAGKRFVEEAQQAIAHVERAVFSARAVFGGSDEFLYIGRSAYTDPWLVSMMLSVHLPFHPGLRIQWSSNFSHEIAREVIAGTLDLALTTGLPENPKLTCLKMAEEPLYIAMSWNDCLATHREVRLTNLDNRNWVLFSRHVSPYMYDTLQREASKAGVGSSELHHVTGADEAVPLILDRGGLAFLTKTGAWRIAWEGITIRPLAEENLRLITCPTARADSKSRLVNDFVKAAARTVESLRRPVQTQLPLSA
jgi:DNA-binding transcriptional LysR family regulator